MNFDWKYYINRYGDLKKSGINTKKKAYQHWVKYGKNENRVPCANYKKNKKSKKSFFTEIDNKLNESETEILTISNDNKTTSNNFEIEELKKDISQIKKDVKKILNFLQIKNNNTKTKKKEIKKKEISEISFSSNVSINDEDKIVSSEDYINNSKKENNLNQKNTNISNDSVESNDSISSDDVNSENFIKYSNSNELNLSYDKN